MTIGNAIAGESYEIICEASLVHGIQTTPFFTWFNSDGDRVANDDDIAVGPATATSLQIVFDILKLSDSDVYTCEVTLYSLALQSPLVISTNISLDVESKFLYTLYAHLKLMLMFAAESLDVTIVSVPDGPEIGAAKLLTLTCEAIGGTGVYTYLWSSTCSGSCFLNNNNQNSHVITRDALRSVDSGVYTCIVTDNAGNVGSNSTDVQVVGKTYNLGCSFSLYGGGIKEQSMDAPACYRCWVLLYRWCSQYCKQLNS